MQKIIDIMKSKNYSKEVIAALLGNIKVECDFKLKAENMNYTTIQALKNTWPSKFSIMSDALIETYTRNPVKLGDFVYKEKGGFNFRGRGYIQLTGITNYKAYGDLLRIDLINQPDLALNEEIAVLIAIEYLKQTAFKRYPKLNENRNLVEVSDIITKSIQGFGKNYNVGFLKEHLENKRNYAMQYFAKL